MLLQREVTEFQFHFTTDDIVFHETWFDALIKGGTRRATEVFPCFNGHGGVGIAQDVSILPGRWNTGIVGDFSRCAPIAGCSSQDYDTTDQIDGQGEPLSASGKQAFDFHTLGR